MDMIMASETLPAIRYRFNGEQININIYIEGNTICRLFLFIFEYEKTLHQVWNEIFETEELSEQFWRA